MYVYIVFLIICDFCLVRFIFFIIYIGYFVIFIGYNVVFIVCVYIVFVVMFKLVFLNKICLISIIIVKLKKNENLYFKFIVYYLIVKGVVYYGCFYLIKVIL